MSGAELPTPRCPLCGSAPLLPELFDPETSMCPNSDCKIVGWDATTPLDDLMTNVSFVDLRGGTAAHE